MKIKLFRYIILSRLKIKKERVRNIVIICASLLVGIVISLSTNVFVNTKSDMITNIEKIYGKYDISITYKENAQVQEMKEYCENNHYDFVVYNVEQLKYRKVNCIYTEDIKKYKTLSHKSEEEVVVTATKEKVTQLNTILIYAEHDKNKISLIEEYVKNQSNTNERIYSSNYGSYENMLSDLISLKKALFIFVSILCLISSFVILYTYQIIFYERMQYWNTLRLIGLSKKLMKKMILCEISLYIMIGSLIGGIIGNYIGVLICINNKIEVQTAVPQLDTFYIIGSMVFLNIVSIMFCLKRKENKKTVEIDKKNINKKETKGKKLVSWILISSGILIPIFVSIGKIKESNLIIQIVLLITVIISMVVISSSFIVLRKLLLYRKSVKGYLIRLNMESHMESIRVMTICLIVMLSILFILNGLIQSFENTAITAVDKQIKYDLLITGNVEQEEEIKEIGKSATHIGTIKEDIVQINEKNQIYICSVDNSDFNNIYQDEILQYQEANQWTNQYKNNGVIISKYLAEQMEIEIGDMIDISYDDKAYRFSICNIIETNDFLSQVIYVDSSNEICKKLAYKQILSYYNCDDDILKKIKENTNQNISIYDTLDIKKQWIENTSSGLVPIRNFVLVIDIAIIGVVLLMIFTMYREKIYNYKLLSSLGCKSKTIKQIIIIEVLMIIINCIIVSNLYYLLYGPLAIKIMSILSNYELVINNIEKNNIFISISIVLVIAIIMRKYTRKIINEDLYEVLVKGETTW